MCNSEFGRELVERVKERICGAACSWVFGRKCSFKKDLKWKFKGLFFEVLESATILKRCRSIFQDTTVHIELDVELVLNITLWDVQFVGSVKFWHSKGPVSVNATGPENVGGVFQPPGHEKSLEMLKTIFLVCGAKYPRSGLGTTTTVCERPTLHRHRSTTAARTNRNRT